MTLTKYHLKYLKASIFFFLLFGLSQISNAQTNEIIVSGKVGSDSSMLENATIQLKSDLKRSVKTDKQGRYEIKVPASGNLIFSNIGFDPQEIPINGRSVINIILKPANNDLTEVVITGFGGTQKKASAVSSITTVNVKDLRGPTGNITNALAGRIPGMISFQRSGEVLSLKANKS